MTDFATGATPGPGGNGIAAAPAGTRIVRAALLREYASSRTLYRLLGLFLAFTLADAALSAEPFLPFIGLYLERAARVGIVAGFAVVAIVGIRVLRERHDRPLAELGRRLLAVVRTPDNARWIAGGMVLVLFMSAFLFNKMRIPEMNPFGWDRTFMEWDRALFLGHHPWEVLQPLLGYPAITLFIDYAYSAWVPLVFVVWLGMMARAVPPEIRAQYWLATVLSWIVIGLAAATLLSSAGPCYYDLVVAGEDNPYRALDAYLASVGQWAPLSSSFTKEFLWAVHSGAIDDIGGISAMPSMHNAQAALFAAAAYRLDRRLGHLAAAFLAVIFLGSIHLGWHYAVDGIAGIAGALMVWGLAGAIARREARAAAAFTQS